jgi:hypothetical protein
MKDSFAKYDICIRSFMLQVYVKSGHCGEEQLLQWENYFCG